MSSFLLSYADVHVTLSTGTAVLDTLNVPETNSLCSISKLSTFFKKI